MRRLFFLFGFWTFWFSVQAVLINTTIDDTTGDPFTGAHVTYSPPDAWHSLDTCIANASTCTPNLNVQRLSSGTWHESTFSANDASNGHPNVPLTASVSFNGSAVYIFCAISQSRTDPDGDSDMTFYLDGVPVGSFAEPAPGIAGFDYNVPVFANPAISPGPHTLIIQNGHQNGGTSLLILDSIVYTRNDDTALASDTAPTAATSSPRHVPGATLAVIIVLVFAILVLLAVLVVTYRCIRRRRVVYAHRAYKGSVHAFPTSLKPTPTPRFASGSGPAPLPPIYTAGNWWVGRDQKSRDGMIGIGSHRPYMDLDPAHASVQRPQGWEHSPR
ncbi:hypothetical protein GGX14DRAFT_642160 [Mycena pura]|uniref:Uncharacterized protein n=1 Tax=Mycena pura TaxID=153505 RepID=A0AAD6YQA2_9AGAR|nr:hypothetical protein GGX14DRAFT_642160 [Mycena pura]